VKASLCAFWLKDTPTIALYAAAPLVYPNGAPSEAAPAAPRQHAYWAASIKAPIAAPDGPHGLLHCAGPGEAANSRP